MARLVAELALAPESVLCRQGELSDGLYVLIAGNALVTVTTHDGEKEVGRLSAGDVVGELSAFDRLPRSATVRCVGGPAGALFLPGEDFRRLLEMQPRLQSALMETITHRLRERLEHA